MQLVAGNKRPIGGWDYLSEVIPLEKALYSAAEKTAAEELERPVCQLCRPPPYENLLGGAGGCGSLLLPAFC